MAIDEKLLSFAGRLRATLDAVNAELAAKGVAEAGDYSAIPAAVRSIKQGVTLPTQEKSVSPSSNVREVVPDEGYTLSKVTVGAAPLESGSAAPSASEKTYYPASGKYGFSQFKVGAIPSSYVQPASTQAAKTWTPTTSAQSIPAGTYCSGKQTIGAIPSDYVKPTSKQTGGTYTLAPGESVYRAAGTYLTSALDVTAETGSVKLGGYVEGVASDESSISFTVSEAGAIGGIVYLSSHLNEITSKPTIASVFFLGSTVVSTTFYPLENSSPLAFGGYAQGACNYTISGKSINLSAASDFRFASGLKYYLTPIYPN